MLALHLPDGFLPPKMALLGWAAAAAVVAISMRRASAEHDDRIIPLMGMLAAFVFAAESVPFPVVGGTSGHLLGGALVAIVLGPWAGVTVMAIVVGVQALLLGDGGLLAMGWNILNMGVYTALGGYCAWVGLRACRVPLGAAAFVAAWFSAQTGAAATGCELGLAGVTPMRLALGVMVSLHVLLGLVEAALTAGAVMVLSRNRPELFARRTSALAVGTWIVAVLGLAAAAALVPSPPP